MSGENDSLTPRLELPAVMEVVAREEARTILPLFPSKRAVRDEATSYKTADRRFSGSSTAEAAMQSGVLKQTRSSQLHKVALTN